MNTDYACPFAGCTDPVGDYGDGEEIWCMRHSCAVSRELVKFRKWCAGTSDLAIYEHRIDEAGSADAPFDADRALL